VRIPWGGKSAWGGEAEGKENGEREKMDEGSSRGKNAPSQSLQCVCDAEEDGRCSCEDFADEGECSCSVVYAPTKEPAPRVHDSDLPKKPAITL